MFFIKNAQSSIKYRLKIQPKTYKYFYLLLIFFINEKNLVNVNIIEIHTNKLKISKKSLKDHLTKLSIYVLNLSFTLYQPFKPDIFLPLYKSFNLSAY